MIETQCPSCFRVECSDGETTTVVAEGGARRPRSPAATAWPALRAVRTGARGLHGTCAACGGPMIGPPTVPRAPTWTLFDQQDRFDVPLDGAPLLGPGGEWTDARFEALLATRYAPRATSGGWFGVAAVLPLFLIVFPWLFGIAFAVLFIVGFLTH